MVGVGCRTARTRGNAFATLTYDPQTQALTNILTTDSTTPGAIDNLTYAYNNATVSKGAGLLVKTVDKQNNNNLVDTQCYTYDYNTHLQQAWTATDDCAATPTPGNSATVGGPLAPYWQSWAYDSAGNRRTQTDHDTTGDTANDTTTTYHYPSAGSATDQPHTLTSTTATGPGASQNTATYHYDPAGNTDTVSDGAIGDQNLVWNDQGRLPSDATNAGTTGYVYDADGELVVRRDPDSVTGYLGDQQLVLNTATNTTSATRYYSINGQTVAVRSSDNTVEDLIPDRQGTDDLAINIADQTVTRRYYTPFGQNRGTAPASWLGDKGYVGGDADPTTQLENLGVRQYDPATGRFLSADPYFESGDPTQTNGYDYAGNDPVTHSDPNGLRVCLDECGGQADREAMERDNWIRAQNTLRHNAIVDAAQKQIQEQVRARGGDPDDVRTGTIVPDGCKTHKGACGVAGKADITYFDADTGVT